MNQATQGKKAQTLTEWMRVHFKGVLDPVAQFLNKLGILPDTMTILGLAGNTVGALLLSQGYFFAGGLVILIVGPIDALDGTMARLRGVTSKFGAFIDSVTDRYSELVIFGGLLFYYLQHANALAIVLVYAAAAGSVLVSYMRARSQSLGYDTRVGMLTRFERYVVLVPSLLLNLPLVGLWIIAILANLTALQRILDVRRQFFQN